MKGPKCLSRTADTKDRGMQKFERAGTVVGSKDTWANRADVAPGCVAFKVWRGW